MLLLKTYQFSTIFCLIFVLSSCSQKGEIERVNELELETSYKIDVAEPSGLAINSSGTILYTVSDNTNNIYKLSTTGDLLQLFNYIGNDLEGVSTFTENRLLLTEERTKTLVVFDIITGQFSNQTLNYINNDANSGIEGVTYDADSDTIFILNEKNPGLLIRLRSDFSVIAEYELDFANDYSGIFHENSTNNLWIISDESRTVSKCNLMGKLIKSYPINVTKAEGIVVTNDKVYVVSDSESRLYIFKKPIE